MPNDTRHTMADVLTTVFFLFLFTAALVCALAGNPNDGGGNAWDESTTTVLPSAPY